MKRVIALVLAMCLAFSMVIVGYADSFKVYIEPIDPSKGSIEVYDGDLNPIVSGSDVEEDTFISILPSATNGYFFNGAWYDDGQNISYIDYGTFNMPDCDITIKADVGVKKYRIYDYIGTWDVTLSFPELEYLYATPSDIIKFTLTPEYGYTVKTIEITEYNSGNEVTYTNVSGNDYTFVMPSDDVQFDIQCEVDYESLAVDSGTDTEGNTWYIISFFTMKMLLVNKGTGSGIIPNYSTTTDVPWKDHLSDMYIIYLNDITEIGDNAFNGCQVPIYEFSEDITRIGEYAFANCPMLSAIVFDGNPSTIADTAFAGCDALETIGYVDEACKQAHMNKQNLEAYKWIYAYQTDEVVTEEDPEAEIQLGDGKSMTVKYGNDTIVVDGQMLEKSESNEGNFLIDFSKASVKVDNAIVKNDVLKKIDGILYKTKIGTMAVNGLDKSNNNSVVLTLAETVAKYTQVQAMNTTHVEAEIEVGVKSNGKSIDGDVMISIPCSIENPRIFFVIDENTIGEWTCEVKDGICSFPRYKDGTYVICK